MATEVPTFVQLSQEDLQKLLDEVAALRQEVLIFRLEKEEHHQYLGYENPRSRGGTEGDRCLPPPPPELTTPSKPGAGRTFHRDGGGSRVCTGAPLQRSQR
jgi:hypothetical protein